MAMSLDAKHGNGNSLDMKQKKCVWMRNRGMLMCLGAKQKNENEFGCKTRMVLYFDATQGDDTNGCRYQIQEW